MKKKSMTKLAISSSVFYVNSLNSSLLVKSADFRDKFVITNQSLSDKGPLPSSQFYLLGRLSAHPAMDIPLIDSGSNVIGFIEIDGIVLGRVAVCPLFHRVFAIIRNPKYFRSIQAKTVSLDSKTGKVIQALVSLSITTNRIFFSSAPSRLDFPGSYAFSGDY